MTINMKLESMLTGGSDKIFDKARLVNCALMAKIHTVYVAKILDTNPADSCNYREWTPAILAHPTLEISMNANWQVTPSLDQEHN